MSSDRAVLLLRDRCFPDDACHGEYCVQLVMRVLQDDARRFYTQLMKDIAHQYE